MFCRKIKGLQLHISQLIPEVRGVLHQLIIFQIQKRRTAARFIILTEHARRFLRSPHPLRIGIQKKPGDPEVFRVSSLLLCKLPHGVVNDAEGRLRPCRFALCTKDRKIHPICIRQIILQIELERGKRRELLVRSGQSPVESLQLPDGLLFLMHRQKIVDPVQCRHRIVPVRILELLYKTSHVGRKRLPAALVAAHLHIFLHHLQNHLLLLSPVDRTERRSHSIGDNHRDPDCFPVSREQRNRPEIASRVECGRIYGNRNHSCLIPEQGICQLPGISGKEITGCENPDSRIAPAVSTQTNRTRNLLRLRCREIYCKLLLIHCIFHRLLLPRSDQKLFHIVFVSAYGRKPAVQ